MRAEYREIILENIEYEIIVQDKRHERDRLDEIMELLVDMVCSARQAIRIAGDDFPAAVVKSRLLKLDSEHIRYHVCSRLSQPAPPRGAAVRRAANCAEKPCGFR